MNDYTYQIHETGSGTHILIFKDGIFERKIVVDPSEYNPECLVRVLDRCFETIFLGTQQFVLNWIRRNRGDDRSKMIAVGKDMQLLSVSEYENLHPQEWIKP